MARRRKTVPVTTGIDAPEFEIPNWEAIEESCRFKIKFSQAKKDSIKEATRRYLWLQESETKAQSLVGQKSDLEKIATVTRELRRRLKPLSDAVAVSIPSDEAIQNATKRSDRDTQKAHREAFERDLDRGFQMLQRLDRYFHEATSFRSAKLSGRKPIRNFAYEMEALCRSLTSLENAANQAAKNTIGETGFQVEGEAWDRWIVQIKKIVIDSGLSATTSNDTDKRSATATETPFLRLVRELQNLLPRPARRHEHSGSGLAKAIQRAIEKAGRISARKAA